jgi:HlyD family secretion protein
MTATATIEIARRENVLRVPSAALRFKPSATVLEQLQPSAQQVPKGPVVWTNSGKSIAPVAVKTGAADATYTEIAEGPLAEGATLVTRVSADAATTPTRSGASATGNPLMPAGRGPRM